MYILTYNESELGIIKNCNTIFLHLKYFPTSILVERVWNVLQHLTVVAHLVCYNVMVLWFQVQSQSDDKVHESNKLIPQIQGGKKWESSNTTIDFSILLQPICSQWTCKTRFQAGSSSFTLFFQLQNMKMKSLLYAISSTLFVIQKISDK